MINATDIAWLAGVIEADGSVGMGFHKYQGKGKQRFAVKPAITFTNRDGFMLEKVFNLIEEITGKEPRVAEINSGYVSGRTSTQIILSGQKYVLVFLKAIESYMFGEKAIKARLLIQYIDSRLSKKRDKFGHAPSYDKEELSTILNFYDITERKGGKRNPHVRGIINDYISNLGG